MNFYEKYINGECNLAYDEIDKLDYINLNLAQQNDIEKVLIETFERVSYNLEIIHKELLSFGYLFKTEYQNNFEKPLHEPLEDTEFLLIKLDRAVKPFGYLPLSLKYFYRIVGGVNFTWDFETNENFLWNMADPIQIASLDSLLVEVSDKYWKEDIQEYVDDEDFGCAFLELAADDLHKDNVSGGQPYAIEITNELSIDSKFMNESNKTTFIDYLRICFDNCGFPGITRPELNNDYQLFFNKVKPQLKKI